MARDGVGVELHHPPHEPGAVEAARDRRAERRLRIRRRASPDVRPARIAEREPEHLALERRPGRKLRRDGDLRLPGGDRPRRHVHHLVGLRGQVGAAKQVGRRELPRVGAVGHVRADADRAHLLLDSEAVGELRRPPVGRLQVVERLGGVRQAEDADEAAVELELGDRVGRSGALGNPAGVDRLHERVGALGDALQLERDAYKDDAGVHAAHRVVRRERRGGAWSDPRVAGGPPDLRPRPEALGYVGEPARCKRRRREAEQRHNGSREGRWSDPSHSDNRPLAPPALVRKLFAALPFMASGQATASTQSS